MIIEGGKHGCARNLARYLERPEAKARLLDLRGSVTDQLGAALSDWETAARLTTKGHRPLYHAYIRILDGETLTPGQWLETVEKLETGLGLAGHSRAIIAHGEGSGIHLHVVWTRLQDGGALAPMRYDRRQFHAIARWAEAEFGLLPTTAKGTTRRVSNRDIKAIKGRGTSADEIRKITTQAWRTTTTGEELRLALLEHDLLLVKGDRREFVLDVDGYKINPVRLLDGVTAAEFRERMQGVEVSPDHPPASTHRGRKAHSLARSQIDRHLANDEINKPPKRGFNQLKKHSAQLDIIYDIS